MPFDNPAEAAAKKLAWQIESRSSWELQVDVKITRPPEGMGGNPWDFWKEHYIEKAGKRTCDFKYFLDGKLTNHSAHFWDGEKAATVEYEGGLDAQHDKQTSITISRTYYKENLGDRMERPVPLLYLYVGHEPLDKALLTRAKYQGTDKVLDRECDLFLFEKVKWSRTQDHIYFLDRETAVPLKIEAFADEVGRNEHKPIWVWTAESLDRVENLHLPLKSTFMGFKNSGPNFRWDYSVTSIQLDKDYPTSTFWVQAQPGTTVFDLIKNKTIPGVTATPTIAQKEGATATAAQTIPANTVQATPPTGWAQSLPTITFALGAAILAIGLLQMWRRR